MVISGWPKRPRLVVGRFSASTLAILAVGMGLGVSCGGASTHDDGEPAGGHPSVGGGDGEAEGGRGEGGAPPYLSGGQSGHPSAGADGQGGQCPYEHPECCEAQDRMPCRDLDEATCRERAHCLAAEGSRWKVDDGPVYAPVTPRTFVGCLSQCGGGGADAHTCVFRPEAPEVCFVVSGEGLTPDGWTGLVECEDRPTEACLE
jgi:hypothetical protein